MKTESNKVTSTKRQETAQRIIGAIRESSGLLTLAAKKAGVTYKTVWQYTQDYPEVKEAVEESKERMLDFTEGKLYEKIKEGDNTAIIFFLKTQGKKRGFIERQEVTGEGGQPISYENIVKDAETRKLTDRLITGGAVVSHISLS